MKKISIILLMIVAFTSCTKENLVNTTTRKADLNTNTKAATQPVMRIWYDNGGSDYGCIKGKGNCLPTTDIVADKIKLINNLFCVVKSANQPEIIHFFKENRDELSLFFEKETIDNVLNGTFVVKDKDENAQNERFILFVLPSTGEITSVNPFVSK
ncbi:MAG: hypothetical protein PHN55_12825 [Dysgonamonadaceae bacterium]|nr:hypothetical protein [Bacteroidales bacterium]MDD4729619.1 hypothetical protein [Dysgonamonadaceae bacterium]